MRHNSNDDDDDDDEQYDEYVPVKRRRLQAANQAAAVAERHGAHSIALAARQSAASAANGGRYGGPGRSRADDMATLSIGVDRRRRERKGALTLLDEAAARAGAGGPTTEQTQAAEEAAVLSELTRAQGAALVGAAELAKGVQYTEPMPSSWVPPRYLTGADADAHSIALRNLHRISVTGDAVPPPVVRFTETKLPPGMLAQLRRKGIKHPSPIQMQGLPVALAGRDMIGVAFTGSGKSLAFILPLVARALEAEMKLPFIRGEGPAALILSPSRELARQTFDIASDFCHSVSPLLRPLLAIGGARPDTVALAAGVHLVVATPGRLLDMLRRRTLSLAACAAIALDEADRLIDGTFETDVRDVLSFFSAQRQTLMFSATMPDRIRTFAASAMTRPVTVNVGRAGAAALNIVQCVEVVTRPDERPARLLAALQKTKPPALVFVRSQLDADEVLELLLSRAVAAACVHGGRDQPERERAVAQFRAREKDVLVATDVAAKGLDFPSIHHVLNYDMPPEIQTYVHRIGRTGRGSRTGTATTFVAPADNPALLADLVHLMLDAKQHVPQALYDLVPGLRRPPTHDRTKTDTDADADKNAGAGTNADSTACPYCGGFGHRVTECPVLEAERMKALASGAQTGGERFNRGGFGGGEW